MKAKTKTDDRDIKTLDAVSHILLRPNMYVGGVKPSESEVWVLNEDGSISYKKVTYVEGLLKITQEAIDNSIDEGIKTNWEYSTKINVKMDKNTFSIEDNGRGIPVKKNDAGE
jgi:DNA topoisomerase-2